jgi:hypothetical protein
VKDKKSETSTAYKVTLRRDVQQVAHVIVEATSRQEAIGVAESIVVDAAWIIEDHIGSHRPEVHQEKRP